MGSHQPTFNMKIILAFALFIAVASAVSVPTCEQKNEVFKNAILRLSKEKMAKADCSTCFDDVLGAVVDCFLSHDWLQCVEDVLGAGNPCIHCVCEIIDDVCATFGCSLNC